MPITYSASNQKVRASAKSSFSHKFKGIFKNLNSNTNNEEEEEKSDDNSIEKDKNKKKGNEIRIMIKKKNK